MKRNKVAVSIAALALCSGLAGSAWAGDADHGAQIYSEKKCGKCHGDGGQGDGAMAAKLKMKMLNWTDKTAMAAITDAEIKEIIEKGGKAVGKDPKMPKANGVDATGIEDLLAFIRSLAL